MSKKKIAAGILAIAIGALLIVKLPAQLAWGKGATSYSLKETIETALEQNNDIKLIKEKIELEKSRRSAMDGDDSSEIQKKKADKAIWDLEREKEQLEEDLKVEVTRMYHQVLIKKKANNLQIKQIERLKNEYETMQKQVELGNNTESQLRDLRLAASEGESKLSSIKNEMDSLYMDLNIKMGQDVDGQLILEDEEIPEEKVEIENMDTLVDNLLENSDSIKGLEKDLEIAEEELAIARENADGNQQPTMGTSIQDLEDKVLQLQYDIEDEKVVLEYRARADYNTVLNNKDTVALKNLDYEKSSKLAEIAKLRHDFGYINYLEYTKAGEDASNALLSYEQSRLDYYINCLKYKNFIQVN